MKSLALLAILLITSATLAQSKLVPHQVSLRNGKSFSFNLPADFEIIPAAEGLKRIRFFAKAPDGRIFVTFLYNLTDNRRGAVYILDGWNAKNGKFVKVIPYLTGLHNPNSVQFYRDDQDRDWLYIAETDKLTRRRFTPGEERPTDLSPQTLATFPDYGLSYKYGGWHLTRTIAFSPAGKLYVSVGSSCNSCEEKQKIRASIIEMNPDGSGQSQFASGLRNAVGLKWIGNFLWASNQGSDHLGTSRPDETFYAVKDGADYGWPYCHSAGGRIVADPKLKRAGGCLNVTKPYASFPARSSALGFDLFDDAETDTLIKNAFLVSLHGSTNKAIGHGYKIVIMRKGQALQDFVTGFLKGGVVNGRPCDIMKLDANSFLFTDDHTGVVYYVRKKGWTTSIETGNDAATLPEVSKPDIPKETASTFSCLPLAFAIGGLLSAASFKIQLELQITTVIPFLQVFKVTL